MILPKLQTRVEIYSWALWLAALIAAMVFTGLAYFGQYPPGDVTIARAIQSIQLPGLNVASDALYRGGLSPVFPAIGVGVAAILFWRRHHLAATFVLLAVASRGMSLVLKEIVERPRPSASMVDVSEQAGGFSFPSGHVLGTVLLLGFIFVLVRETIPNRRLRLGIQISAAAVIALMGLQRVYAGAHWPTDVLAAYLWGGVILFALVQVYRFCGRCHWRRVFARVTSIRRR